MVPVKTTWGICGGKSSQDLLNKEAGIWDRRAEDEGRKLAGHGEKDSNRQPDLAQDKAEGCVDPVH